MLRPRHFWNNRGGNFALATAVLLVPLGIAVGAAVDLTGASALRSELQAAADSAALAALSLGGTDQAVEGTVGKYVLANSSFLGPVNRATKTSSSGNGTQEVEVTLTADLPTEFLSLAGVNSIPVRAVGTARKGVRPPAFCIYALDPNSNGALSVTGSGELSAPNCGIQVNSSTPNGLRQTGAGRIAGRDIAVVGGYQGTGYSVRPKTSQPVQPDPLLKIPQPVLPATCNYENRTVSNVTVPAGSLFCGSITFSGTVTLAPGMHFFKNASVSMTSTATLVGKEVTLYLNSTSSITQSSGSGSVQLSAPTSGTYAGIAVFGSRTVGPSNPVIALTGNRDYFIDGSIYLPRHILSMTGTGEFNVQAKSGYVIAWQFWFTGNSSLNIDIYTSPAPNGLGETSIVLVR